MLLHSRRPFLVIMALVLLLISVAAMPKTPAFLNTHETDEPLMPRMPPVTRPDVLELKIRLSQLNLYDGPMDATYELLAQEAVKRFQKGFWLAPTGVVDLATWRALGYGVERPAQVVTGPPPEGFVTLEIDMDKLQMTVLIDGKDWKTYTVAGGKWTTLTPVGEWKIVEKGYERGGAFGSRWMALDVPWGSYGIHGTNRPWSIGSYASAGCVRMFNEDVEELYEIVPTGTPVIIRGPRPALYFANPLRRGAVGPEVVLIQERMRILGFDPGECDGQFGGKTEAQVRDVNSVFGTGDGGLVTDDVYTLLGIRGRY